MAMVIQQTAIVFTSTAPHPRRAAAEAFCTSLLAKNASSRLGSVDYMDIIGHGYFQDVDFDKLTVMDMPLTHEELEVGSRFRMCNSFIVEKMFEFRRLRLFKKN